MCAGYLVGGVVGYTLARIWYGGGTSPNDDWCSLWGFFWEHFFYVSGERENMARGGRDCDPDLQARSAFGKGFPVSKLDQNLV